MKRTLFPPASTPWLLCHELRITWRGSLGRFNRSVALGLVALFGLGMMFIGVPVASLIAAEGVSLTPILSLIAVAGFALAATLMLSQALMASVLALHDRHDLDLLLSAPVPAGRVLTARAAAIAINVGSFYTIAALMLVVPLLLISHEVRWLALLVAVAGLALLATVVGLATTLGLFALVGPRMARLLAQILSALSGAVIFLIIQAQNLLPGLRAEWVADIIQLSHIRSLDSGAPLSWPARIILAEPIPLAVFTASCLMIFLFGTRWLGQRFNHDAMVLAGIAQPKARYRSAQERLRGFPSSPLLALIDKDLRLLRRDVTLISQVTFQILYLVPLGFAIWRLRELNALVLAGSTSVVVFFAGGFAARLALSLIHSDNRPDLTRSAPISASLARWAKLFAVQVPTLLLIGLATIALAIVAPSVALMSGLGAMMAAIGATLIQLWREHPTPASRLSAKGQGSVLIAFGLSAWLSLCALTTWLITIESWAAIVSALIGLLILGLIRPSTAEWAAREAGGAGSTRPNA